MPRTICLRAATTALLLLLAMGIAVASAPAAQASCAGSPEASPYSFSGVVLGTELAQRVAYVSTDDGRSVVVRGTASTADDAFTTVDRTYRTGHRYVFHPVNATSPYEDNACTATLDLGPAPTTPTTQPDAARTTAETELADVDDDPGPLRTRLVLGALAGVALLVVGLVLVRRSGRQPTGDGDDPTGS